MTKYYIITYNFYSGKWEIEIGEVTPEEEIPSSTYNYECKEMMRTYVRRKNQDEWMQLLRFLDYNYIEFKTIPGCATSLNRKVTIIKNKKKVDTSKVEIQYLDNLICFYTNVRTMNMETEFKFGKAKLMNAVDKLSDKYVHDFRMFDNSFDKLFTKVVIDTSNPECIQDVWNSITSYQHMLNVTETECKENNENEATITLTTRIVAGSLFLLVLVFFIIILCLCTKNKKISNLLHRQSRELYQSVPWTEVELPETEICQ